MVCISWEIWCFTSGPSFFSTYDPCVSSMVQSIWNVTLTSECPARKFKIPNLSHSLLLNNVSFFCDMTISANTSYQSLQWMCDALSTCGLLYLQVDYHAVSYQDLVGYQWFIYVTSTSAIRSLPQASTSKLFTNMYYHRHKDVKISDLNKSVITLSISLWRHLISWSSK